MLTYRKATLDDLPMIINLLSDDELGQHREQHAAVLDQRYIEAFHQINADPNHYLMVVLHNEQIVGTCHLTLIPSLTFMGSTRLQIEAVHIAAAHRCKKIGEWMMNAALDYAKKHGASIVQLTTNKQRVRAKRFYEQLGFKASHEGMKYYIAN